MAETCCHEVALVHGCICHSNHTESMLHSACQLTESKAFEGHVCRQSLIPTVFISDIITMYSVLMSQSFVACKPSSPLVMFSISANCAFVINGVFCINFTQFYIHTYTKRPGGVNCSSVYL